MTVADLRRRVDDADPRPQVTRSHQLCRQGRYAEAADAARAALAIQPRLPIAHNNLGVALQNLGRLLEAEAELREALRCRPTLRPARRNLAALLVTSGRRSESLALGHGLLVEDGDLEWLSRRVTAALTAPDLTAAGELAWLAGALRRGSAFHPTGPERPELDLPVREPERTLTPTKLRHDVDQFEHLRRQGLLAPELAPAVRRFRDALATLEPQGEEATVALDGAYAESLGDVFNRIVHLRDTPRVGIALSTTWDPAQVERAYLGRAPGLVVIDDFLSPAALAELRAFCLESTVWTGNRYRYGRIGAFFQEGFNCPLLLQIAEELRAALPQVIGDTHSLRQIWGYKNTADLPANATTHADFAAVNVNFWITPDRANREPSTGGLVIHGVDAPPHWDFHTYNGRSDIIRGFLARQNAGEVTVPYRQNRAIVFNSDLFHGTDRVRFGTAYEDRRINVTMLYGIREEDHRRLARPDVPTDPGAGAWRSAALRVRHRR